MRFVDRYPIIVTPEKDAARDFWVTTFGFEVAFDSSWFVLVVAEGESASLAFMTPDHPSAPPGPEVFGGRGVCFELEVDDVQAVHDAAVARGLPVTYPLTDEPFGQRRFGFTDPSGLYVDILEPIESAAGYWDTYLA